MNAELIIIKRTGDKSEYLAHRGHEHFWSPDIAEAMNYSKKDVAVGLCVKLGGTQVKNYRTSELVYQQ